MFTDITIINENSINSRTFRGSFFSHIRRIRTNNQATMKSQLPKSQLKSHQVPGKIRSIFPEFSCTSRFAAPVTVPENHVPVSCADLKLTRPLAYFSRRDIEMMYPGTKPATSESPCTP